MGYVDPQPGPVAGAGEGEGPEGKAADPSWVAVLLSGDGAPITDPQVVTTNNGAGWGRFDVTLQVPGGHPPAEPLVLRVFANSAQDGREINVVDIPLTVSLSS